MPAPAFAHPLPVAVPNALYCAYTQLPGHYGRDYALSIFLDYHGNVKACDVANPCDRDDITELYHSLAYDTANAYCYDYTTRGLFI
jgi:hypothetical protein